MLILTILLSTATCLAGETWIYNVTFEEYNISETLEPYLITEEEWPPVIIDVDWLLANYSDWQNLTQEELEELKTELEQWAVQRVITRELDPADIDLPGFIKGFIQYVHLPDDGAIGYTLARFENDDQALLCFLEAKDGLTHRTIWIDNELVRIRSNATTEEYPMGNRAVLIDQPRSFGTPHAKCILVKSDNLFVNVAAIITGFQADEMLVEKMAAIVAPKLGIPETGILVIGLIGIGLVTRRR